MSCLCYISATVTCKKLILGRATSWYDLDLTFDLAVVISTFKTLSGNISKAIKFRKIVVGKDIACRGCRCAS